MGLLQQKQISKGQGKKRSRDPKPPTQSNREAQEKTNNEKERQERLGQWFYPLKTVIAEGKTAEFTLIPMIIYSVPQNIPTAEKAQRDP